MKGRYSIDYLPYHIGYGHENRLDKIKIPTLFFPCDLGMNG